MEILRRLRRLVSWITVEPVEFLYCLMFTTSIVVRDNLFLDKVCLMDAKYPADFCYNLTHGGSVDKNMSSHVQSRVADLEVIDGVLVALPAVIFCLFVGAWSDTHGRKPVLILPFIGNILSFLAYMANYYWMEELSSNHLLWGSIMGATGQYVCLNIGLYGYVSDVTTSEDRTMRLSILNGVFSAGYVAGVTLGGKLYKYAENYYLNFGLSVVFGVLGILYSAFFVKESAKVDTPAVDKRGFFNLGNVRDSLNVAFKPRPNNGRVHVILLIVNFAIFMFCLNTTHYDYLLVINKYQWDAADYSNYLSVQRTCRFLGLFVILPLLSRVLKLPDSLVAAGGTVLTIAAYLLIALGPSDWSYDIDPSWLLYLSTVLQLNSVITVTIRSQCTKEVDQTEIGRIFAVVALGQAIVPLVANPLFGLVYNATLDTLPGAYILCIVVMLGFVLASSIYMTIGNKTRRMRRYSIQSST